MLPTDTPEDPTIIDQCPSCRAATENSIQQEAEGLTVHHCATCRTYWVVDHLHDVDEAERAILVGEHTQAYAQILEENFGLKVKIVAGSDVWDIYRRLAGEPKNGAIHLTGVEVRLDTRLLAEEMFFLGEVPRTGIQRLGGQPVRSHPDERVWTPTKVEEADDTLPSDGSVWSDGTTFYRVLGSGIHHDSHLGRRLSVHVMALYSYDESVTPGLSKYVWVPHFLDYTKADDIWQGEVGPRPTGHHVEPKVGETWWSKDLYAMVEVTSIQATLEGRPWVVFTDASEPSPYDTPDPYVASVPHAFFSAHFSRERPEPPCKPGEEWERMVDQALVTVISVTDGHVEYVNLEGVEHRGRIPSFLRKYRPSKRKSAMARLLDEDLFEPV